MYALIGLSRRVLSVLLGALLLSLFLCRGEEEAVPSPCPPDPAMEKTNVEAKCHFPYWADGLTFPVLVSFQDKADFAAFKKKGAYLCYTPVASKNNVRWNLIKRKEVPKTQAVYLFFEAKESRDGDGRGTGKGRVIVTKDNRGNNPEYKVANVLDLESIDP